jgi:hypothetical protein
MTANASEGTRHATDSVGKCADCRHAEVVTSSRKSTFYLCRLSATDPRFPKYPALPVLACDGYATSTGGKPAQSTDDMKE